MTYKRLFQDSGTEPAPDAQCETTEGSSAELDDHLVSLKTPTSFEAERYQLLCHKLDLKRKTGSLSIIAITSPVVGDGKTTTAINLAGALAQATGVKILLVDADFRKPSVGAKLGVGKSCSPSLVDAIQDPTLALKDVVRHYSPFNLSVLLTGQSQGIPYELLQSPQLDKLLEEARQQYDYIVVDTPPLVPVPDCQAIANRVDGFLVVVAAHKTPQKLLEEALDAMEPAKIIGLVFNGDDRPHSGYYTYYYHYVQSA